MSAAASLRDGLIGKVVRDNALLIGLVLTHFGCALVVAQMTGTTVGSGLMGALRTLLGVLAPAFVFVLLVWRVGRMLIVVRPDRPIAWLIDDLRGILLDRERLLGGAIALTCIAFFQRTFSFLKDMVPVLNPFDWDLRFADWDRALHFGREPFEILMPLVQNPQAMQILNGAYHFWFFLMLFMIFVACFDRTNPKARNTFLLAHVLTWAIGGNLIATLLSSAGPVYFERLGFGDTYVPLMTALQAAGREVSLPALSVQQMLWDGYVGQSALSGISAMPSMHLASTMLLVRYAFTYRRWAGTVLCVFWCVILIGSVTLGWHYAIDGYAGATIALVCWSVAARLSSWRGWDGAGRAQLAR